MEALNIKDMIHKAREVLAGKDVRRLAMIHAGVTVGFGLVLTVLQYLLLEGIGNTSGLSGMGTRSVLETVQTVLQWANTILLPFWNLGFLYAALQWARGNNPGSRDLLTGFYRIGPCLGLLVNRMLLTICMVVLAVNIGGTLYMMMPSSAVIREMSASFQSMDQMYDYLYSLNPAQIQELFIAMIPMLGISTVLSLVLLVPLLYRFRLAEFAVLNYPGVRGISAMLVSATLLRRRRWQLFKLDLHLWWYYGLQLLCALVLYAELILGMFGITMPGGDLAFLLLYLLYLACVFAVETLFRPQVVTAYAVFYEQLVEMGPVQKTQVPATSQKMPWDEQ